MKKWFVNLKIAKKFTIPFVILAIAWFYCVGYTFVNFNRLDDSTAEAYNSGTLPVSEMSLMATSSQKAYGYLIKMVAANDSETINSIQTQLVAQLNDFNKRYEAFDKSASSEIKNTEDYKTFKKCKSQFSTFVPTIIALAQQNKDAEANYLLSTQGSEVLEAGIDAMNNLTEKTANNAKTKLDNDRADIVKTRQLMSIFAFLGIFVAIAINIIVIKMVLKGSRQTRDTVKELSMGHLDARVDYVSKDELGETAEALNNFADNLQNYVLGALHKISEGDVNIEIPVMDEKDQIGPTLNHTLDSIKCLIDETEKLSKEIENGNLSARGDISKFNGGYINIVNAINGTLESVIKPMNETANVMEALCVGNLKAGISNEYKGDYATLTNAVNKMVRTLNFVLNEISTIITRIADADLNITDIRNYEGDFNQVTIAFNKIVENLNGTMREINAAAVQVAAGSGQIADTSVLLSQGSEEQASSIEQVTTAITQMAAQVQQNAANANEADLLSRTAKDSASKGDEQMKKMLQAMQEINESSNNISKIIKVIDDIAFQTNILALNAAVEAARAGQYGKGFAVVADEVRNLAQKSAAAAQETTAMIESSIDKVKYGTDIASNTESALKEIVDSVTKSSGLVSQIASASNQQASAISQVSQAIEQVSGVVQTNSATAEETASASEELTSQAEMLKGMVNKFKLKNGTVITANSNSEKSNTANLNNMSSELLNSIEEMLGKKTAQEQIIDL